MATCHACGATLPAAVGWCLRCHASQRRPFAARRPMPDPPGGFQPMTARQAGRATSVLGELPRPMRSRWHAGPTSFGIWGRVLTTLFVVLMFPWSDLHPLFTFLFALPYVLLAGVVLWHVWQKDAVYTHRDGAELRLLETQTRARVRAAALGAGAFLVLAAIGSGPSTPAPFLPAVPFLLAGVSKMALEGVGTAILRLQRTPLVPLVALNVLNVVDTLATDAAIRAGHAAELNPFITMIGTPGKLAIVGACSGLLYWKRPQALVWPMLVFVVLTAYHFGGYLLTV